LAAHPPKTPVAPTNTKLAATSQRNADPRRWIFIGEDMAVWREYKGGNLQRQSAERLTKQSGYWPGASQGRGTAG
jgi:hypothetical protein